MSIMRPEEFVGLDYPERYRLAAQRGHHLTVYVPAEALPWLAPGSGIVGKPSNPEELQRVMCWYEGWTHGAMQYAGLDDRGRWEAAVDTAAGRAFVFYPTIACRSVPAEQLREVGTITAGPHGGQLDIHDEAAVTAWLAQGGPGR